MAYVKHWEFLKFWKHTWPELQDKLSWYDDCVLNCLPDKKHWFKALELVKPKEVRCVILGQDPYPTRGHANGLAFSVYPHVRPIPRSLGNIFSEYQADLGFDRPRTGDLTQWARSG